MFKKLLFLLPLFLSACVSSNNADFIRYCPNAFIDPTHDYVTKISNGKKSYTAKIIGYEGYCLNKDTRGLHAGIAPILEISLLAPVYNGEITINFYTNVIDEDFGFGGKKVHTAKIKVPKYCKQCHYTLDPVMVKIPNDNPGARIELGLSLNQQEYMDSLMQGIARK